MSSPSALKHRPQLFYCLLEIGNVIPCYIVAGGGPTSIVKDNAKYGHTISLVCDGPLKLL